jgi:peptidyl-prolyl cis-trans isomerase C
MIPHRTKSSHSHPLAHPVKQLICAVLLAVAAVGCQRPSSNSTPTTSKTSTAAPAAADAPTAAASAAPAKIKPVPAVLPDPIAKVNGEAITKAELEAAIRAVELQNGGRSVPPERRDEIYRGVLDNLVSIRVLRQEVTQRQMTASDADVATHINQLRKQFPSEAAFKQAMAQQRVSQEKLRDDARMDLLVNRLLESEVNAKLSVKPGDVSAFYEKNPDKFAQSESVRASHILIIVPSGADPNTKTAARARAEDALKAARAGSDFSALARQYSQDGSAQRGGDLGFVVRGQTAPAFENAAFALQEGQISDVVESPFGFHVIKVTERRPGRAVPFPEAAGQIQQFLEQQQRQSLGKAFVDGLKAKRRVEIYI